MRDVTVNSELVACCGLYCGACSRYLKEKCPGCRENAGAGWCKVRSCCSERSLSSCADCAEFADPRQCRKFNNVISRLFAFIFHSDRPACIDFIRREGRETYAAMMAELKQQAIKR